MIDDNSTESDDASLVSTASNNVNNGAGIDASTNALDDVISVSAVNDVSNDAIDDVTLVSAASNDDLVSTAFDDGLITDYVNSSVAANTNVTSSSSNVNDASFSGLDSTDDAGNASDDNAHFSAAVTTDGNFSAIVNASSNVNVRNHLDNTILEAILKAMELNDQVCGSQQNFVQILQFGRELYGKGANDISCTEHWPSSYRSAMSLLEANGYRSPKEFYICLNESHYCLYDVLSSDSDRCKYCNETGSIKYSYLPLIDKVQRWCQSSEFCDKMLQHWAERDHWLPTSANITPKKEIWDGERFSQLSWFWNPESEWVVPVRCPCCKVIVSSTTILAACGPRECNGNQQVSVFCPECSHKFDHEVKWTKGDPRNIALIGHWDGWQPFSTSSKHSSGKIYLNAQKLLCIGMCVRLIGAIEVSIATMSKEHRSSTDEVYVCGFVPKYLLPNKRPNSLDPFLQPLIEEIEDSFVEGKKLHI